MQSSGLDGPQRQRQIQLGLWVFLSTVTMLFAAFTSAYIVRQAGADWQPVALPTVLWLNTAVLAASSVVLEVGRARAKRSEWRAARAALLGTFVLGVAFLVGQVVTWSRLASQGIYVPTTPHSSFFYIMTGLHGLHLLVGLILLLYAARRLGARRSGDAVSRRGVTDTCATFWHFFGVVWLYLFVVLTVL